MTNVLLNDLKTVIDGYLDGHRSRNLASLSRVSGVAYTTLRRFAQMEGHPTAEPVLKILDAALSTRDKIKFIQKHFPEIADSILSLSRQEYPGEDTSHEIVTMFVRRVPHCYILNLATNTEGTSVDTVQRLYGDRGVDALDEMVEVGIIERQRDGQVTFGKETLLKFDSEYCLAQIRNAVEVFDRTLVGTDAARAWHRSAAVSAEGLQKINEIVSKAFADISAISQDSRYFGKIPYYAGLIMNVYDKQHLDESREN